MKLHNLLHEKYKDWKELETRIESLPTTKEKGDAFEDFVYLFLEVKKDFYQIEKHWIYQDHFFLHTSLQFSQIVLPFTVIESLLRKFSRLRTTAGIPPA